jgi:hypothetical protein
MATMPSRAATFPLAIRSIIDQVDRLYLYLDGHDKVPESVRDDPRVVSIFAQEEPGLGCIGKFMGMLREREPCLYVSVDDDIAYPPNYVSYLAHELATYDSRAVVGIFGVRLKSTFASYPRDCRVFHFAQPLSRRQQVDVLGSGTMMYDTAVFQFDPLRWQCKDDSDIQLALEAIKRRLPLVCVPRRGGFVQALAQDQEDSLFRKLSNDASKQTRLALELQALRSSQSWRIQWSSSFS